MVNTNILNNDEYLNIIDKNVECILARLDNVYDYKIGIILGSGLTNVLDNMKIDKEILYAEMYKVPISTVKGHEGKLVFGTYLGKKIVCMCGRAHYYEGYSMKQVTLLTRVLARLGIRHLIVTNAAGGLNKNFKVGDVMLITDHINFTGINPLIGANISDFGERFPSMQNAYNEDIIDTLIKDSKEKGIDVKRGVYAYMTGPSYETPAEINALRVVGADAVGMSTVPEVIVARHSGIKVTGMSIITNLCARNLIPTHEEVLENAKRSNKTVISLINALVEVQV